MRIVVAPRDENDVLAEDRARLCGWAPSHGWSYLEYADVFDLLARVRDLQSSAPQQVTEMEIVAHGNPVICDDVAVGNAAVVGESLRRIAGIVDETAVYLSGCNTGLEFNGECVARVFAETFQGPVFGWHGYIGGTHAESNERCVASFELEGIVYHAYPGGIDAGGADVWKRFGPSARHVSGEQMQIKIATSGFRAVNLADSQGQDLVSAIEQVVRTPPAQAARMRTAPDLTFALRLSDGERVFELLAGGTVLRDLVTKHVWQFERGREILRSLLPHRKLPAA
jgi:hypothetical protein